MTQTPAQLTSQADADFALAAITVRQAAGLPIVGLWNRAAYALSGGYNNDAAAYVREAQQGVTVGAPTRSAGQVGVVTTVDPAGDWAEVRWTPGMPAYRYSVGYVRRVLSV